MPTAKERKLFAERLRQLAQLGYVMPCEYQLLNSQPSEVIVEQCAPPFECPLFDLREGGTLFLVWLSMAAERPVCLYDFRFVPPWPDREFQTLPTTDGCRGPVYVLPNGWEFPLSDVLNLRFRAAGLQLHCTRVEGLLCGLSTTPIPRNYRHGEEISVRVEFFGRSGRRLAETVSTLWVDQSVERWKSLQRSNERAKAEFAAQRALRRQSFLRDLTPDEAQKLGVHCEAKIAAIKSESTSVDRGSEHATADAYRSHSLREAAESPSHRRSSLFE